MVFVWIGLGVGVLVAVILIRKILKTSPRDALKFSPYCKKCGYRTNGLKCPRCESTTQQKNGR